MYLNLLLGVTVLAAVIWLLVIYNRKEESPGDMLTDELSRRRAMQENARRSRETLEALRRERLAPVEAGLAEMRSALNAQGLPPDLLDWQWADERLELCLARPGNATDRPEQDETKRSAPECFIIRWDVRQMDVDFPASGGQPDRLAGEYSLTWPNGVQVLADDLQELLRAVSRLIAERLA